LTTALPPDVRRGLGLAGTHCLHFGLCPSFGLRPFKYHNNWTLRGAPRGQRPNQGLSPLSETRP